MAKSGPRKENEAGTESDGIEDAGMKSILDQADALKLYLEREEADSVRQLMHFMDTLKEAIVSLTVGDLEKAAQSVKQLSALATTELFRGIGEITRDLHGSIVEIQKFLEPLVTNLSEDDLQGLSSKLTHVSTLVKDASDKTLDLLFARQETALSDNAGFDTVARLIVSDDKKGALLKLKELKSHNTDLVNELMRISELQIHADLVDQIIKKVSRVVDGIQRRLVDLIRHYGGTHSSLDAAAPGRRSVLNGPAVPGDSQGAASSQDDVDSLLKSFGL